MTLGALDNNISTAEFDLSNLPDAYFQDPRPWLRALRNNDPLHRTRDDSVLITRYEDVRAVWRDLSCVVDKRDQFTRKFGPGPLLEHHTTTMLFRDPPDHDRLRNFVNSFFSASNIKGLTFAITERVDELIAAARERGEIDFVQDFALALTTFMICRIVGIPYEDGEAAKKMGGGAIMPLNPDADAETIINGNAAVAGFKDYLRVLLNELRRQPVIDPRRDVLSALASAERNGDGITEDEILHMCILMFNGGYESTSNLLSISMKALIEDPQALSQMRDPGLALSPAMEELIRFASPLQLQGRRTSRETELSAGTIRPGTEVIISVGGANWDERVFEDPDRLDLTRSPNLHIAFGAGVHACMGRPLAKMEATVALPAFVRAFRQIEPSGPSPFRKVARFRGVSQLPLCIS